MRLPPIPGLTRDLRQRFRSPAHETPDQVRGSRREHTLATGAPFSRLREKGRG